VPVEVHEEVEIALVDGFAFLEEFFELVDFHEQL
jgi:hypothetical protein